MPRPPAFPRPGRSRIRAEKTGQRQPERGERTGVKEVPAGQAVAEPDAAGCVEANHQTGSGEGRVVGRKQAAQENLPDFPPRFND